MKNSESKVTMINNQKMNDSKGGNIVNQQEIERELDRIINKNHESLMEEVIFGYHNGWLEAEPGEFIFGREEQERMDEIIQDYGIDDFIFAYINQIIPINIPDKSQYISEGQYTIVKHNGQTVCKIAIVEQDLLCSDKDKADSSDIWTDSDITHVLLLFLLDGKPIATTCIPMADLRGKQTEDELIQSMEPWTVVCRNITAHDIVESDTFARMAKGRPPKESVLMAWKAYQSYNTLIGLGVGLDCWDGGIFIREENE